jgi:hypothetical protein
VSLRTRVLLAMDWGKRTLFGRGKLILSTFTLGFLKLTCVIIDMMNF